MSERDFPDAPGEVQIGALTYSIHRFDPREANERAKAKSRTA